jgi:hypothetical protein
MKKFSFYAMAMALLVCSTVWLRADTNINLTFGTTYLGAISEPGEVDYFTFNGTAGQRLYYDALENDFAAIAVRLIGPAGAFAHLNGLNSDADVGPFILTMSGTYTMIFDGSQDTVGGYKFRLLDLASSPSLTVGLNVTNQLSPRIETDIFQFNGTIGQRVNVTRLSPASSDASWRLVGPANQNLLNNSFFGQLGAATLPATGPYYLLIDGNNTNNSPLRYRVNVSDISDAPVAVSGLGGDISGAVIAGQTNVFTFTASAGTPFYYDSMDRVGSLTVEVRDPNNALVFSGGTQFDSGPHVLPRSGTYSIRIRGNSPGNTGNFRFRPLDLLASPELSFGTTISNAIPASQPYRTDIFKFTRTAGERFFYDALDADSDNVQARLYGPQQTFPVHVNGNSDNDAALFTLAASGQYFLVIESGLATSADYQFRFLDLASQPTLPFDTSVSGTLNPGRSVALYQFAGNPGQQLFFNATGSTGGGSWLLYDPNNTFVNSAGIINDFESTIRFPGTHAVVLDGSSANNIPYAFEVVTFNIGSAPLTVGNTVSNVLSEAGEQDIYTFTGTFGQRVYYDALENDFDQINVRLVSPNGTTIFNGNSDSDQGILTLPETGTYSLIFDANGQVVGDYHFRLLDLAAAPVAAFDTVIAGSLSPGRSAQLYQVSGTAGQHLYFNATGPSGGSWYLQRLNNQVLSSAGIQSDMEVDLTDSGTYALILDGNSANPVSYSFTIVTPVTQSFSLTIGTTYSNLVSEPGEQHVYTFAGALGQRLYYDALEGDSDQINMRLVAPGGSIMRNANSDSDFGPFTLVEAGTYSLIIDPNGDLTGNYVFRLLDIAAQPVLPLDTLVTNQLNPGFSAVLFQHAGAQGQQLYLDGFGSGGGGSFPFYGPSDELITSASINSDFETTLARSGAHVLVVDGNRATPVPYSFQVVTFGGSTNNVIFGSTISGSISEPGEQDVFTFNGTVGQRLFYDGIDTDFGNINFQIIGPSGGTVISSRNSDSDVGPFTLTQTGTYLLIVDGGGAVTGNYDFRLLDLASAPTLTFGAITAGQLNPRSETDLFQFAGTRGQRVNLDSISASVNQASWRLVDPADGTLGNSFGINTDIGILTLPSDGAYVIFIQGNGSHTNTLDYQFRVTDVSDAPVAASGLGAELSGTVNAGQTNTFVFTAPAGLPVFYDSLDRVGSLVADIRDPNNVLVFSTGTQTDSGPHTLPRSGTYTIQVRGSSPGNTGNFRFRLLDLTAVPVLPFNTLTSSNLTPAYKTDVYQFSGSAGQQLFYDAIDADFDQVNLRLYGPGGFITSRNSDSDSQPFTLPASGSHYLVLESTLATFPDYHFRLYDIASQPVLPFDMSFSGTIDPGQGVKVYRFDGNTGDTFFFDSLRAASGVWTLYDPNNAHRGSASLGADFESTLPVSGSYTLLLDGNSATPINHSNRVVTFTVSSNSLTLGSTVTSTIAEPGEQDSYEFTGSIGQRLYYDALEGDFDTINVRLIGPNGNTASGFGQRNSDSDFGTFTLVETGTYRLVVDGNSDTVGDYTFRLIDLASQPVFPFDTVVAGTLNPGYSASLFRIIAPPEGASLYFDSLGVTGGSGSWHLRDPVNTAVSQNGLTVDFEATLGAPPEGAPEGAQTATYALIFEGNSATVINHTNRIVTPENSTNALTLGATVISTISEPGELDVYTFSASAGQRLYYDGLEVDFDQITARIIAPSGGVFSGQRNSDSDLGPFTLNETGIYQLILDGTGDHVADYRFRLLDVAAQPTMPLDTIFTGTLNPGYSVSLYTYSGAPPQHLIFDGLGGIGAIWQLFDPLNRSVGSANINGNFEVTLETSGTFVLVFDGNSATPVSHTNRVVTPNHTDPTVNRAPVLAFIGNKFIREGEALNFTASATDADGHSLTFSLDPGNPAGSSITTAGAFSWTPPVTGFPSVNPVTIRVTDSGVPALSAAETISVVVVVPPFITRITRPTGGSSTLTWRSAPEKTYRVQLTTNLQDSVWSDLPGDVIAEDLTASKTDATLGTATSRFYRVLLLD